jgi:hypothetical protein
MWADNSHRRGLQLIMPSALDAALLFVGSQATLILRYFLSQDIRIARERAWDYTVASRGKGPEFWQPYVEEWDSPPQVDESRMGRLRWMLSGWAGYMIAKSVYHSILHRSGLSYAPKCSSYSFVPPGPASRSCSGGVVQSAKHGTRLA